MLMVRIAGTSTFKILIVKVYVCLGVLTRSVESPSRISCAKRDCPSLHLSQNIMTEIGSGAECSALQHKGAQRISEKREDPLQMRHEVNVLSNGGVRRCAGY
jgi:hypothetical protein